MNKKKKYRLWVLSFLFLDILAISVTGYRYLNRKIPEELHVAEGQEEHLWELFKSPFLSCSSAVTVSQNGTYLLQCNLFGVIPFKQVKVIPSNRQTVMVSGSTVGIYMATEGVMIIDTGEIMSQEGLPKEPARNIVKPGDYIVTFNEQKVSTKSDLMKDLTLLDGEKVILGIHREGKEIPVSLDPVKDQNGQYKLGIWVRDDTQGIGTLTYVKQDGSFGALGHGISDVDTGELLNIREGALYQAQILGIQKGKAGSPGELAGLIRYDSSNIIGTIASNSKNGIYGSFYGQTSNALVAEKELEVAYKQEVTTGPASILCCVDGTPKEYEAEITKIDLNHEDSNKSFVIQVTDEALLDKTGGIVQGMSGSPVIQNGRFAGAVTHVFVQDASSGYGIFAETMLEKDGR